MGKKKYKELLQRIMCAEYLLTDTRRDYRFMEKRINMLMEKAKYVPNDVDRSYNGFPDRKEICF